MKQIIKWLVFASSLILTAVTFRYMAMTVSSGSSAENIITMNGYSDIQGQEAAFSVDEHHLVRLKLENNDFESPLTIVIKNQSQEPIFEETLLKDSQIHLLDLAPGDYALSSTRQEATTEMYIRAELIRR